MSAQFRDQAPEKSEESRAHDYTPRVVYTDSRTAMAWFREKRTASKRKTPALFKAEVFLQAMAVEVDTIDVVHWDKESWGETPADFGLK